MNLAERIRWRPDREDWLWPEMTTGDTFFRWVEEAVCAGTVGDAPEELERWEGHAKRRGELDKLEVLRALVWCGREAGRPDAEQVYTGALDGALFAMSPYQPFSTSWEQWAWVCIRTLLEVRHPPSEPPRRVTAPIALVEPDGTKAFIASLELELVPGGAGQIAHHPIDAVPTTTDKDFREAMANAWAAACAMLGSRPAETTRYGRWRVLRGEKPEPRVLRSSAGGAALRRWWCALQNRKDDDGVIVVTALEPDAATPSGFRPCHVDSIDLKMKAIADDGRFDTVVVAEADKGEARKGLNDAGAPEDKIRVL